MLTETGRIRWRNLFDAPQVIHYMKKKFQPRVNRMISLIVSCSSQFEMPSRLVISMYPDEILRVNTTRKRSEIRGLKKRSNRSDQQNYSGHFLWWNIETKFAQSTLGLLPKLPMTASYKTLQRNALKTLVFLLDTRPIVLTTRNYSMVQRRANLTHSKISAFLVKEENICHLFQERFYVVQRASK